MDNLTFDNLLNNFVCFDYETKDPFIDKDMGQGWVYKLNYPELENNGFTIGAGIYDSRSDILEFRSEIDLDDFGNVFVGQNLIYDLGWYVAIHALDKTAGISMLREMNRKRILLVDTMVLARLVDEYGLSYSLATLTKKYNVTQKNTNLLADAVFDTGLYSETCSTETRKFVNRPKDNSKLLKMAYKNMDKLPIEIVKEYCLDDVKGTTELYRKLINLLLKEYTQDELLQILQQLSTLQYAVMEMRINGVAIDNEKLKENHLKLCKMLEKEQLKLNELAGMEVNVMAKDTLPQALFSYGYKEEDFLRTPTGGISITQGWLEEQHNELTDSILRVRKLNKIISTFIDGLRSTQDELQLSQERHGKVHGQFNIFGTTTGRFSSSNPNLQQIPKRDPEFYEVCRSMFIAGEGKKFIAADYSNQEQRIQVHYGKLLNSTGAAEVALKWNQDPELDFHQTVADICDIGRREAKTINLGKSYGMGEAKLCKSLGLPTEKKIVERYGKKEVKEVAGEEGKRIIDKYNALFPFLNETTNKCREVQKDRGYIKSLGGRHLHTEMYFNGKTREKKYFKAFNQLIQGSAADMTIKAITKFYDAMCFNYSELGIDLLGCVHDELLFSVPEEKLEDGLKLIKNCMENAYSLEVPMLVNIDVGDSWYAQK